MASGTISRLPDSGTAVDVTSNPPLDFNDITEPGLYAWSDTNGQRPLNRPARGSYVDGAGFVIVIRLKSDGSVVIQLGTNTLSKDRLLYRYYMGGSWTSWDNFLYHT